MGSATTELGLRQLYLSTSMLLPGLQKTDWVLARLVPMTDGHNESSSAPLGASFPFTIAPFLKQALSLAHYHVICKKLVFLHFILATPLLSLSTQFLLPVTRDTKFLCAILQAVFF